MDGGQKTSDRANCKGELALTVIGKRRLRHNVRSQRSQTLAQITIQLNDGASRTVSKRNVQRSLHRLGFGSHRQTKVPLLNARHRTARLVCAREHRDWSVEQCFSKKDNCTSHKFRVATSWLDDHSSDFSVINWPPRSPDLNPIEHLWDVLEQGMKGHHTA
ncbi:transposable element Tc1 transposase [Trichonephila clavipes]|uniref:Transposable element Tc1 transposase n=1 Tax=Trichonephila clavipes TaxID=2585209 RepID=A0A8X6SBH1_TRICX|nr:transposable element Tc1 transposase [Trichonephila clavipes]